jgi:hypothetical protein
LQKYIKDFLDIYRLGDPAYVDCWLDLVAVLTEASLILISNTVKAKGSLVLSFKIEELSSVEQVLLQTLKQAEENETIWDHIQSRLKSKVGGEPLLGAVVMVIKLIQCAEFGALLDIAREIYDEPLVENTFCAARIDLQKRTCASSRQLVVHSLTDLEQEEMNVCGGELLESECEAAEEALERNEDTIPVPASDNCGNLNTNVSADSQSNENFLLELSGKQFENYLQTCRMYGHAATAWRGSFKLKRQISDQHSIIQPCS